MGKLTATMVIDLKDSTGAGVRSVIGNLSRLEKAERDLELANRGVRLSRKDRAMEAMLIEKQRSVEERQRAIGLWAMRGAAATAAVGIAAGAAYKDFAQLERTVNRIVINADKGPEAIQPTIDMLQDVAKTSHMGFGEVVGGLEALIASGRSLEDSMKFLPSVAITAQASGAAMNDVALSADALSGSMGIGADKMQKAFDILVAGGKAGKFELKDMSQYLPSLLPAFSALGYKGTEGLQKIVAMLQVVRNQAGSSSEAATYVGNVLNKVYSADTAKKFKDMGINLPKTLDKARKSGKDVLEVFLEATRLATKGDLSKLPLLFTDSEMQKGVRALLTQRDALRSMNDQLGRVDGSTLKDFNQIAGDSAAKIQNMSNLWDKFVKQVGSGVATVANPTLEAITDAIDNGTALARGNEGLDFEQRMWRTQDFYKRYYEQNPDAKLYDVEAAYDEAVRRVGRGQAKTVFDQLDLEKGGRKGGEQTARYPSRGSYDPAAVDAEREKRDAPGKGRKLNPRNLPKTDVPIPTPRPERDMSEDIINQSRYPSRGSYDEDAEARMRRWNHEQRRRILRETDPTLLGMPPAIDTPAETQPGKNGNAADASSSSPKEVILSGTPSVVLSGTPSVTITNPPPRPNIYVSVSMPVTIKEAQNANSLAQELGANVRQELQSLQASTNDAGL